ncbi:MAG TPA: hypothetical protein VK465_05040 [Fibrobacteria bacterium]|nr:hypothetical protein [Fibrobacteria bacterium]
MEKLKTVRMPVLFLFLANLLGLFACQLTQEEKVENTLNFTSMYDSLSRYDTVRIELRRPSGEFLDIVYHGHVDTPAELRGLRAPGWDGGKVEIIIQAFQVGSKDPVLRIEKTYDGINKRTEETRILKHPNPGLSADTLAFQMVEGQSRTLPTISVRPAELVDKSLRWSSSNPAVVTLVEGRLQAIGRGTAEVTAVFVADTTRTRAFQVTVVPNPNLADSLHLEEKDASKGALVAILSPADGTYTNRKVVTVRWSVDGQERESLDTLKIHGANTLSRAAKDAAGKESVASVIVHWDTVAPPAPVVNATNPTNVQPRWSWSSGNGGSGEFRAQLGSGSFAPNAPTTRDTTFALVEDPVSGTTYTLYVEERDLAGNWSASGSLAVRFDNTRPTLAISSPQASGTYYTRLANVTLEGTVTGPYRMTAVRYKVDEGALATASLTGGKWKITSLPLTNGEQHGITVTATDSMGTTTSATLNVVHDNTPPPMPTFSSQPADIVSSTQAVWEWTGAPDPTGSGPSGRFRYSLNGAAFTEGTLLRTPALTLREGQNEIQVQQQDRAGNWSASATHVVRLDTRGPSFAITSPVASGGTYTETSRLSVTLAGTVSDTGIGVKEVSCALSGKTNVPRVVASLNENTWSLSTQFASGSTQVVCTALDNFDRSTQASVTVNVAIPKPVISKLSVRNGMVLNRETFRVKYDVTVEGRTTEEFTDITLSAHQNDITLRTKVLNIAGDQTEMNVTYWYQPNVVFVDPDAKGNSGTSVSAKDGTSWGDAFLTFHDAVLSAKGRSGAMIWLSRGTYTSPEDTFHLQLPKSGAIVGGFLGSALPRDSALASRNPGSNQAVIQDYYLDLDTLHRSLILDGLHFANARLYVWNPDVVTPETRLSLKNCTILGLIDPQDFWSIHTYKTLHFDMINCSVTNTYIDQSGRRGNNWGIMYRAFGTFTAQRTRFEQPVENGIAIITGPPVQDDWDQVFRFDDSHLLYKLPPNTGGSTFYQIDVHTYSARFEFVNGSTVLGGLEAINTYGPVTGL